VATGAERGSRCIHAYQRRHDTDCTCSDAQTAGWRYGTELCTRWPKAALSAAADPKIMPTAVTTPATAAASASGDTAASAEKCLSCAAAAATAACSRSSSCSGRGSGSSSPPRTRKPEAAPPAARALTTGTARPGGACSSWNDAHKCRASFLRCVPQATNDDLYASALDACHTSNRRTRRSACMPACLYMANQSKQCDYRKQGAWRTGKRKSPGTWRKGRCSGCGTSTAAACCWTPLGPQLTRLPPDSGLERRRCCCADGAGCSAGDCSGCWCDCCNAGAPSGSWPMSFAPHP